MFLFAFAGWFGITLVWSACLGVDVGFSVLIWVLAFFK